MGLAWQLDALQRVEKPSEIGEATGGWNQALNLTLGYGLGERLGIECTVPFVDKRQQVVRATDEPTRAVRGLGDPLLLLKSTVVGVGARNPRSLRIGVAAGAKAPVGEDSAREGGTLLPQAFQISSGAWEAVAAGFYSVGAFDRGVAMGSLLVRVPTANDRGYRFGTSVMAGSDLQVTHLSPVVLSAGVRLGWAAPDTSPIEHIHASGGGQVAAHVGVGWSPGGAWFISADAVVPVVRALTGNQMALQHGWTLAVRTEL